MLKKIIEFSIHHKWLIAIGTFGLVLSGIYSLKHLSIDAVPDITNNQVQVITTSPTLATQEVESLISYPVEQAMATIAETEQVRSISRFGLSVVTIVFKEGVDIYWARQQVNERLTAASAEIPPALGKPSIAPLSTGLGEVYQYVLHAQPGYEKKFDGAALRSIQDWIIKRQLLGTPGVAEVNSFGGYLKQYEVALDPNRLLNYNIGIHEVYEAMEKNNANTGGAYIDKRPSAYFIRSEGLIHSLDDLGKIVVRSVPGELPVLIRDLGTVQFGHAARYGALTRTTATSQGEAVGGIVMMLKGANASEVVEAVKEKMERIGQNLPKGVTIEPYLDRSELVDRSMSTVTKNLLEGALIVIFVLVLFLGNLRAGLIVASVIPLSMLFAICLMHLFGVSGNLMSLGAIDFGLIVDGGVIIVEGSLHMLGSAALMQKRRTQHQMDQYVTQSSIRMMRPTAFGQLIILIVYLPILTLSGIEGKMFRPMAETVSFAIIGAFILSMTYVPMMTALCLSKSSSKGPGLQERLMTRLQNWYRQVLTKALKKHRQIAGAAVLILMLSIVAFLKMGGEFLPTLEEGDFAIETRLLTGSSLSQSIDKVSQASGILVDQFAEVEEVVGKIGAAEIPTDPMPMEATDITVILKDKKEWPVQKSRTELADEMSKALAVIPGVSFGISQPIELRSNELISGVRQDIGIKIFGDDLPTLKRLAEKVASLSRGVEGAKDIYTEQMSGLPQIVTSINRDCVARYGLSIETINEAITAAFAGKTAGKVYEGDQRYDLVVRLQENSRQDLTDVQHLLIKTPTGKLIPLSELATVKLVTGPNQIQREQTKRRIIVGMNVRGQDITSVVAEIKRKMATNLQLPTGYYVEFGGQFENLQSAKDRLAVVLPVALLLILVLLYLSFGSFKQSMLICSAIPMAAIGGVWALYIRQMPFSISAGVGFIALFGVAVLNGIVLLTELNRLKQLNKYGPVELILMGATSRLRPVLMTGAVASLGFMPMALSHAAGAEVQKPLATVVIGGLISATLLTLILLPILYRYVEFIKIPSMKKISRGASRSFLWLLAVMLTALPSGLLSKSSLQAQTIQQNDTINLQQAIQIAVDRHPLIKTAALKVEKAELLSRAAATWKKTSLGLQYGQMNGYSWDNAVAISQELPNPWVSGRNRDLQTQRTRLSKTHLQVTKNELIYQVKQTYTQLAYYHALSAQLKAQDTIYSGFLKAASLRYETGETKLLEKTTAQASYSDIQAKISQNDAQIKIYTSALQQLLQLDELPVIEADAFQQVAIPEQILNPELSQNPSLQEAQQQIAVTDAHAQLEKSHLTPDFQIGYFNQSMLKQPILNGQKNVPDLKSADNTHRFQGIELGISIPLFNKSTKTKIKAARLQTLVAKSEYQSSLSAIQAAFDQASGRLEQLSDRLAYFRQEGLPNADNILHQGAAAYRNGAIDYIEYLEAVRTYTDIQLQYLSTLHTYNQSIFTLELMIGNL